MKQSNNKRKTPGYGKCTECGKEFNHDIIGRIPNKCPEHRVQRTDAEREQTARNSAITRERQAGQKTVRMVQDTTKAMRMALGLSLFPDDLTKAGTIAGLGQNLQTLLELSNEARRDHPELIEMSGHGWKKVSDFLKFSAMIQMIETLPLQSPTMLPKLIQNIAYTDEVVSGKSKQSFSNIIIQMEAEEEEEGDKEE